MTAPWVLDGPINRQAFETYVAKVLVPELRPGDIVVPDNLSSHKGPKVRDLIEKAGASLFPDSSLRRRRRGLDETPGTRT
jgi:hypothetical protein